MTWFLMDIRMPKMDGFEATARLRELSAGHRDLPLVAFSAHAMTEDREHYDSADFAGVVAKPFAPAELVAAVRRHIYRPARAA